MAITLGNSEYMPYIGGTPLSEVYRGANLIYRLVRGADWMGASNGSSGKYAYTDLKYVGIGIKRTYQFHVASINGGTLQVGIKHGTHENDFISVLTVTKPGWYSFDYTVTSGDAYRRFSICMTDGTSAAATASKLTAVGTSGTAVVDQVYVE